MPGLLAAAKLGRNGDTRVGHLTPGEIVIPREVSALRPDLVAHVASGIKGMGMDPSKYVVGNGRVNPKTGVEEFATEAEVRAAYQQTLGRDADAGGLAYWMSNDEGFRNGGFAAGAQKEISERPSTQSQPSTNWGSSSGGGGGSGLISSAGGSSSSSSSSNSWGGSGSSSASGGSSGGSSSSGSGGAADVNDWYRNVLGRDADQGGLDYWNNRIASGMSAQDAYNAFVAGAQGNKELVKGMDYSSANADYKGELSTDGRNLVDDWARNTLGRPATAEEYHLFAGANGNNQAAYDAFVKAAQARGENVKGLDLYQASQLPIKKGLYQPDGQAYSPNLYQTVQADQTIEGRINNLLKTDANGNYTNDVVRQAAERAMQSFAARGLLNSSMAQQAAQEAAISKAIEITGPDAQRFFEQSRANQDAQNTFARDWQQQQYALQTGAINNGYQVGRDATQQGYTQANNQQEQDFNLRQNYITQLSNVTHTYQQMVDTINNSNMEPDAKTAAIANAARIRDSETAFVNTMFANQPSWKSEWLTMAVNTKGVDIDQIGNIDTLSSIIADPAQPADVRKKATDRRALLISQGVGSETSSPPPQLPLPVQGQGPEGD